MYDFGESALLAMQSMMMLDAANSAQREREEHDRRRHKERDRDWQPDPNARNTVVTTGCNTVAGYMQPEIYTEEFLDA